MEKINTFAKLHNAYPCQKQKNTEQKFVEATYEMSKFVIFAKLVKKR